MESESSSGTAEAMGSAGTAINQIRNDHYFWDITGTLKTAIDRLYAPLVNASAGAPKETVLLMTSGGSTIHHMLDWYKNFGSCTFSVGEGFSL